MELFLNKTLRLNLLFIIFLLTSCGGSGSTTEEVVSPIISPPTPTNTEPICSNSGYARTLFCSMKRKGLNREFYVYIPDGIEDLPSVPLLFGLHGYTSRAIWFLGYSGFQPIADTEKFIVIYPQGSILITTGQPHWNVGGWTNGSTTDDVDFISYLIDWSDDNFNINTDRVYSTGMSNGGYMSFHLACNLSHKIAAIASVTGSMTPDTYNSCNPIHSTSVMQIHGDADTVVPYYGNWRSKSIPSVMEYWEEYNNCQSSNISSVPDNNSDGDGGLFYLYDECIAEVQAQLYLMTNMGHEWPRLSNDNDINAADVIWNFFQQYDINGRINE